MDEQAQCVIADIDGSHLSWRQERVSKFPIFCAFELYTADAYADHGRQAPDSVSQDRVHVSLSPSYSGFRV